MPRSNSSSCMHDPNDCFCKVVSSSHQKFKASSLVSIFLLAVFGALFVRFAGLEFVFQLIPQVQEEIPVGLMISPSVRTKPQVRYVNLHSNEGTVYQYEALIDIGNIGYATDTYGCTKRFLADDPISDFFQSVQVTGGTLFANVAGPITGTAEWLTAKCQSLLRNPYAFVEEQTLAYLYCDKFTDFFRYLNFAFELAGSIFVVAGSAMIFQQRLSLVGFSKLSMRHLIGAILLPFVPLWTGLFVSLYSIFSTMPIGHGELLCGNYGCAMAGCMRGGAIGWAAILAHSFAPLLPFVDGVCTWFSLFAACVVSIGMLIYFSFVVAVTLELLVLFAQIALQSFAFSLCILLCPVFVACVSLKRTEALFYGYVAVWLDFILCLVSWTVLMNVLGAILTSGIDPFGRLIAASIIALSMIFTPRAISYLNLSPMSKYMAMDPVTGFAKGVEHLASKTIDVYMSFQPPR